MAREKKFTTKELFQETKQILLENGYDGFTFGILAERLEVSRGAIYKYFDNKDELIVEFMLQEMKNFLVDLNEITQCKNFHEKFNYLIDLIFQNANIHQIIAIGQRISNTRDKRITTKKKELDQLHIKMYHQLDEFIQLGKKTSKVKPSIPNALILGFIFQTIAIPNHFHISRDLWINSIKEIILDGISNNN
ncbi:TetR/AcrR family transcriptional regulator [Bacillus kwashiorkori]|uniref:TetR/AcrR family transcriptional regulator n=1 Tax=Bacillus kwashiorkori TaxID=1522318 RepID=UPI00078126A8|nr:TetR/AcrR family transcriptional regulator [Bacillus kwashiorkori]